MKRMLIFGVMVMTLLNGVLAGSGKDDMKIYLYEVEIGKNFTENTYLIVKKDERVALIIDPGKRSEEMERFIARKNIRVRAVLNTHGHFDHTGANRHYAELYKVPIWCGAADKGMFVKEKKKNMPTHFFDEDQALTLAEFEVKLITTSGHSPGSACFLIGEQLFAGDTLFKESIGRTWGKDEAEQQRRQEEEIGIIKRKLLVLPGSTDVYPGHGDKTTIKHEASNNPFL